MTLPVRRLLGLLGAVALAVAGISMVNAGIYGYFVFLMLPLLVGGIAAWSIVPRNTLEAAWIGAGAAGISVLSLLLANLEGLICILMTLPLAILLGALGGWFAYAATSQRNVAMLLVLQPLTIAWDFRATSPLFEVQSSIEIAASPEKVWKNVVSFSDLPEPAEWYFHTGLAYPLRARIAGTGPGAIRYCEFSTGPFVEPIQVWDEPRLLQFNVTSNPAPMREWSPHGELQPKHLHGYMVSKKGQFRLVALPGNRTRLEGTTWYQHGLWPAQYWRWWSDAIIHRIHLRVLNHIRTLSES